MRSVQMAQIWRRIWGGDERLHTVVQHQADWVGGEADILLAPLWRDRSGTRGLPVYVAPHSVIDMLTVHAQIDGGMAYGARTAQIEGWRTTLSETAVFDRMRHQMLTGNAWGADRTVAALRPKWAHYRREATKYGMQLGAYEVGNHINGLGNNAVHRDFMHRFSISPQMGQVYAATFNALDDAGFDSPLCMSLECRMPDQNVCCGLQRWLGDHNPAWQAVHALIEDAPVTVPPIEQPPVVVPPVVAPPIVEPEPPVIEPEPTPTPTPTPTPVPEPDPTPMPEEPNMERELLVELLKLARTGVALLEAYLDGQDETPAPTPEPEPTPAPAPEPAPHLTPAPAPAPTRMLPSFRHAQDFGVDRALDFDWNNPNMHIYLPNWAGGDEGNGVGGSIGTPAMIDYNADKSVTLRAGMVAGRWRTGALQVNRSRAPRGKWGAVVTSHTAKAVNAFFVHASNGKELDFELVKRNGAIGWAPAVHMPRQGGGRASSDKRQMALGPFTPGVQQRLVTELFADKCDFYIDGVLFETIRPADMADGFIWDTTTDAYAMATIERHRSSAGWSTADYAEPSSMTVHGFLLPSMP